MHEYQYPRAANTASVIVYIYDFQEGLPCIRVLAIKRKHEPYKGLLALPGGFHNENQETLEETAARELLEETSLDVPIAQFELFSVQSKPDRDPRSHVIDHVYSVAINDTGLFNRAIAGDDAESLEIIALHLNKPGPEFAFDHGEVLQKFLGSREWKAVGSNRQIPQIIPLP
jgi:8-oxo-dGTP diphosphatase